MRISENERQSPSHWVVPFLSNAFGPKENYELRSLIASCCLCPRPTHRRDLLLTALADMALLSQAALPSVSFHSLLRRLYAGLEAVKPTSSPGTQFDSEALSLSSPATRLSSGLSQMPGFWLVLLHLV